jgi:DNA gyrase subunit A
LQILEDIDFEPNEKTIYMTKSNDYSGYLIVGFENGKVGKITISSYRTEFNRKKLKNAFSDESKLIFIERIENDIDLVALSSINKVVIFNTSQINAVENRTTKGVQVMKPKDGSRMIKIKKLNETKINDPNYYRKNSNLNVVGYYLKQDDEI